MGQRSGMKKKKGDFPGGPVVKTSTAGRLGSIPGQGTKIPHAKLCGQNKQANKNPNIKLGNIFPNECYRSCFGQWGTL